MFFFAKIRPTWVVVEGGCVGGFQVVVWVLWGPNRESRLDQRWSGLEREGWRLGLGMDGFAREGDERPMHVYMHGSLVLVQKVLGVSFRVLGG